MKGFGKYFRYHFRTTLLRALIIGVLSLLFTAAFSRAEYFPLNGGSQGYVRYTFGFLPYLFSILCVLMPALELSNLKNRRNLDTLLTLPVSRTAMALSHMLNGLLQTLAIYSACFAYIWLLGFQIREYVSLSPLLPYYFLSILFGIALYAFFQFFFMQANNTLDGVLIGLVASVTGWIVLGRLLNKRSVSPLVGWSLFPTIRIHERCSQILRYGNVYSSVPNENTVLGIWLCIGLLAIIGYFITFAKKNTEKIGGISDTFFGYRVLLPICGFALCWGKLWGLEILGLIATVIGYAIYRRGLRFKLSDYIVMGIIAACAIFFTFL